MNSPIIIGLTGPAGAGKDTFAEAVISWSNHCLPTGIRSASPFVKAGLDRQVRRIALADPLKAGAAEMFDITEVEAAQKEVVLPRLGMSPRRIWQLLGTEAGRMLFGDEVWIRMAEHRIERIEEEVKGLRPVILVTDVRFKNEAEWVRDNDGAVVRIVPVPAPPAVESHSSERGIPDDLVDRSIVNNRHGDALEKEAFGADAVRVFLDLLRDRIH